MAKLSRARIRAWLDMASMIAWDPDAIAYFNRAGTLTANQRGRINDLIIGIKRDFGLHSLSQTFDAFWILANETSAAALKNVVKNDHHCVAINAPTFTAFQGYAGDGSSSYLRTDYIPSTDAVALSLNANHMSIYNRTARTGTANMASMSGRHTSPSTADLGLMPRVGGVTAIHNCDNVSSFAAPADASGYWVAARSNSTTVTRYRNGAQLNTSASASSVALPTVETYICARNDAGTPALYSTDQHALATIGGTLTAAQMGQLSTHVERYMDAIRAGVY